MLFLITQSRLSNISISTACTVEVSNLDTSIEVEMKRDNAFDIEGESSDGMQLDNEEKACNDAEFYHSPKEKGKI